VYVVAQQWDNSGLVVTDSEILTVTAAMVSSGGAITIAAGDLVNMTLTNVNAAFVVYLASGAGIYPSGAIKTEGYFKAI
jgi:adhesin HecA-like repeat protein